MKHLSKAFGIYETNCYIVQTPKGEFIIDPGIDSAQWVLEHITNPLAILITHGHFDHIFDAGKIRSEIQAGFQKDIQIYCPKDDAFMMEEDCFGTGITPCKPDILTQCQKNSQDFEIQGVQFSYIHFPGHTPGCSIIFIDDKIYSGDFIFKRSIGRYDFPYSNQKDMKESLIRFRALALPNVEIFPGHGDSTCLEYEQNNVELWIARI